MFQILVLSTFRIFIKYEKKQISYPEKFLSILSRSFYLGGTQVTVSEGNTVKVSTGPKLSWSIITLKVSSYVLLLPLTLTLFLINLGFRYYYYLSNPHSYASSLASHIEIEKKTFNPFDLLLDDGTTINIASLEDMSIKATEMCTKASIKPISFRITVSTKKILNKQQDIPHLTLDINPFFEALEAANASMRLEINRHIDVDMPQCLLFAELKPPPYQNRTCTKTCLNISKPYFRHGYWKGTRTYSNNVIEKGIFYTGGFEDSNDMLCKGTRTDGATTTPINNVIDDTNFFVNVHHEGL